MTLYTKKSGQAFGDQSGAERFAPPGFTTQYGIGQEAGGSGPQFSGGNMPATAGGATATSDVPQMNAPPPQPYDRRNDPNEVAQTTAYGGSQGGYQLSEGSHGFRQLKGATPGDQGGASGYTPVDQSSGGYSAYQPTAEQIVPSGPSAPPAPQQGRDEWDNPDDIGGGYAGSYSTNDQGLVTGEFGQGYEGRKAAANALGYQSGKINAGELGGTLIGGALGIPGLGMIGGKIFDETPRTVTRPDGSTYTDARSQAHGATATIDAATGGVFGNDGRAYNVHTGEGLNSYGSFSDAWDNINPFNDDKISTTEAASDLGVSDASQAGLRTIKGEDSIQSLLDSAGPSSQSSFAQAAAAQNNQFEQQRAEAAAAERKAAHQAEQKRAAAEQKQRVAAAQQRAQQRGDTSQQTRDAIAKGNVDKAGRIHNPFEANRGGGGSSGGGTPINAVKDSRGNAVRSARTGRAVTYTPPRRESSGGGGGGGDDCFVRGTLFKMWDGSLKEIQDITIGDRMAEGGMVTGVIVASAIGTDWYNYGGTIVSGSHIVKHMGQWMYVADTGTKGVSRDDEVLYCLNNENHIMVDSKDNVFTDYNAIDFDDEILDKLRRR